MVRILVLAAAVTFGSPGAWADSHATDETTKAAETEASQSLALSDSVDMEAAEDIFRKSCRGCHGNKGQGAASYPKIANLEPEYVAEKLELYRAGTRIGPNSTLMIQAAKKLSDEDIASLAVYVTSAFD